MVKLALPAFQTHIVQAEHVNLQHVRLAALVADESAKLDRMLKQTVGTEYQRLQHVGSDINRIRDPKQHELAMHAHAEQLKKLLKKII